MPLKLRIVYSLAAWFCAAIVYAGCGVLGGKTWIVPVSPVDDLIAFNPAGIWLYLAFYIYIPLVFFTVSDVRIKTLSFSFIVASVVSGLIFIFFPSTISYPVFDVHGASGSLLKFVSSHDTDRNCFPSLHGSLIALCTLAGCERGKVLRNAVLIVLTLIMYYAIIQVRRHVFIDLAAGIFLAIGVWLVITKIRRNNS
jgi:membrane-associated phospholipid phosphatase